MSGGGGNGADRLQRFARDVAAVASALSLVREHPSIADTSAGEAVEALAGRLLDLCDRADPIPGRGG